MKTIGRGLILLLVVGLALADAQPDYAREQRLKEQIVDAILDGDPVDLEADGHSFLGIYTEADEPRGAVLILHGRGFHPDWADVVNPLRVGLAEQGWNTLSIQLPVLGKEAKYYDYVPIFEHAVPRIRAALDFLREQGNDRIVLIAHSCGAHMAMQYVRELGEAGFDAFVGIGMGATDYRQPMLEPFPLERMKKPILDLYGSDDYPAVQRLAALRQQQMKDWAHPDYSQRKLQDANHYFTDRGDLLLEAIADWLDRLYPPS